MEYAIEAEGLVKRFGSTLALAGVDFAVRRGSVLGMLGPNGAGKTTAVRILATLLRPDAGGARVAGYDVVSQAAAVRRMVGLTGQYAVDEALTGRQNLVMSDGHGTAHIDRQASQQRLQPDSADLEPAAIVLNLQRPENPDTHDCQLCHLRHPPLVADRSYGSLAIGAATTTSQTSSIPRKIFS